MKPQPYISAFLSSILLCFLSFSALHAQSSIEEDLIGTWALDFNMSISRIEAASRTHYDTINHEVKSRIENSFRQRRMTFQKDGSYILRVKDGLEVQGTWQLDTDGTTLKIDLDGKEVVQMIEQITKSSLVINLGEGGRSNQLFVRWYLNKVRG